MSNHENHVWGKMVTGGLLVLLVGMLLAFPRTAFAWGSLRDSVAEWLPGGGYDTHGNIDRLAWDYLSAELEPDAMKNFPRKTSIMNNDFVAIDNSGNQTAASKGPDYEPAGGNGPITLFSWHYRNGDTAANSMYQNLVAEMQSRSTNSSHSAAWAAHFLADQYVPYHNLGVLYTSQSAATLNSPNYNDNPAQFFAARTAATNGNVDWYDPSYWDSTDPKFSTHITWERGIHYPTTSTALSVTQPVWSSADPEPMLTFVQRVQALTAQNFNHILANGDIAAADAAYGVYTAWRSTLSAFQLDLNVTSSDSPDSFLVSAVVTNNDKLHDANTVEAEITLPPGMTTTDNVKQLVNTTGVLLKKKPANKVTWEVSGSSEGCPEITVKVTGKLDGDIPDAASTPNGGVEATVLPPPIVEITSPAAGATISESKVTVTGTISDASSQAWIEVNGTDKIWISEGFNSGSTFSKEVPLKQGANSIVVKAVNQCMKEGSAAISVTGEFTEPAVKVVMSWDTNGTDVDLHMTDSNGGSECYYSNKNPNWGYPASATDDPLLDIDNVWGYGPETIIIQNPKPGSYTVRVVYYSDHNSETAIPSFVTIKVYEYGLLKGTFNQTLPDTGATWEGVYTFVIAPPAPGARPVAAASVADYTVNENRITVKAVATEPAINGEQIVWTDARHGYYKQIFRYNLITSDESRVSNVDLTGPLCLQEGAAISDTAIVWEDYRLYVSSLYRYGLNTDLELEATSADTKGNSRIAVSGDTMVWEDTRNGTESGGNSDIYMRNLGNGTETRITTSTADQLAPDISGNRIVWTDTRFGGYTIFLYDLTSSTEQQIARASSGMMNPPAIDGDLVVWEDGRTGNGDIFLYDLGTHEERQLTTNGAEQTSPDVSDNKVVWVDYRNGNADIYVYDLLTGVEVPICTNAADQREPRISGNRIVWTDYRNNGTPDIYMAEINPATPLVTIIASDNVATEAGRTTGKFKVTRTGATTTALQVHYTASGTAAPGSDYTALSGSVTIAAGASDGFVTVTPVNDTKKESNETVVASLSANSAYRTGTPLKATVTIKSDDVVPGAPTIGTATAGNSQATVTFTPPVSAGSSPITGYTVTSSPGAKTATGTVSPITVTDLTNGTAYTFTVKATNAVGKGPASAASNRVTPRSGTAQVPGAPTIGTATADDKQATVTFTPPTSTGGSSITGYTVTSSPEAKTATGTASPLTVTGLTNGTAYTFTVQATNAAGTGPASAASNSVTPSAAGVSFTAGPAMKYKRMGHTNVTLSNGRVVLLGGHGTDFVSLTTADVWSPTANTFTAKTMNYTHDSAAVVKLADGRYLIAGGAANLGTAPGYNTAEIYNPTANSFASTGTMIRNRMNCGAALLKSGEVLVVGGWYDNASAANPEVFNPTAGTFSAAGALNTPRAVPVVLPTTDGKAVVFGGIGVFGTPSIEQVELYDPDTKQFSILSNTLISGQSGWRITLSSYSRPLDTQRMSNGKYLLMADRTVGSDTEYTLFTFDPATKSFAKFNTTPALPRASVAGLWPPVVDKTNSKAYILSYVPPYASPIALRLYTVNLTAKTRNNPTGSYTLPASYFVTGIGTTLLKDGRILITGGNSEVGANTNFSPINKTLFVTPP